MKRLKLVGYCRVSTANQKEEGTIKLQEDALKEYCKKEEHKLIEIFKDNGVSGGNGLEERKGLPELLTYLEDHSDIDCVLIHKLDRLARDLYIQEYFIKKLEKLKVNLYSIQEPDLGSDDPIRKAFRQFMGVVSELEKNFITMRLSTGRRGKAKKGDHASSIAPLGYELHRKILSNGKIETSLEKNEEEAETVRWIFDLRKKGSSLADIAEILNFNEEPTKLGGQWFASTIHYILNNPLYKGIVKYSDIEVERADLSIF